MAKAGPEAKALLTTRKPQPPPIAGSDTAGMRKRGPLGRPEPMEAKVYQGDVSVGQMESLLVDLEQSNLSAVVLLVGGFLRVGNKLLL